MQGADLVADAGEDAGDGGQVALNASRVPGLDGWGGQDVCRKGQDEKRVCELHGEGLFVTIDKERV